MTTPRFRPYEPTRRNEPNSIATASAVLGAVGILTFWFFGLGGLVGLVAIGCGAAGLRKVAETGCGKAAAVSGIVLGLVAIGLSVWLYYAYFNLGLDKAVQCYQDAPTSMDQQKCTDDWRNSLEF